MAHLIDVKDFQDYQIRHEVAGSYGRGIHKTLYFVYDVNTKVADFEVVDKQHGTKETYQTLQRAVDAYNRA